MSPGADGCRRSSSARRSRPVVPRELESTPSLRRPSRARTGATSDLTLYGRHTLGAQGFERRDLPDDGAWPTPDADGCRGSPPERSGARFPELWTLPATLVRGRRPGPPDTAGVPVAHGGPPSLCTLGGAWGVLGPNGGRKRPRCFRVLLGELTPLAGNACRAAGAASASVPQDRSARGWTSRSAPLEVALMGSISTLPWWRRPGARRAPRRASRGCRRGRPRGSTPRRRSATCRAGQRQRVLVATGARTGRRRVILLDEPFTGPGHDERRAPSRRCWPTWPPEGPAP